MIIFINKISMFNETLSQIDSPHKKTKMKVINTIKSFFINENACIKLLEKVLTYYYV